MSDWEEVRAAIVGATITVRDGGDDGVHVTVMSPGLGFFRWEREEAERIIRRRFPRLSGDMVKRAIRMLHGLVIERARPASNRNRQRQSWLHGWGFDSNKIFPWE